MITTIQNKQIKQIMKLKKNARERRKQQLFIVEGIRMFTEIPEQYLYKVYASEDFYKEHQAVFEGNGSRAGFRSGNERDFRHDDTAGSVSSCPNARIFA